MMSIPREKVSFHVCIHRNDALLTIYPMMASFNRGSTQLNTSVYRPYLTGDHKNVIKIKTVHCVGNLFQGPRYCKHSVGY